MNHAEKVQGTHKIKKCKQITTIKFDNNLSTVVHGFFSVL